MSKRVLCEMLALVVVGLSTLIGHWVYQKSLYLLDIYCWVTMKKNFSIRLTYHTPTYLSSDLVHEWLYARMVI